MPEKDKEQEVKSTEEETSETSEAPADETKEEASEDSSEESEKESEEMVPKSEFLKIKKERDDFYKGILASKARERSLKQKKVEEVAPVPKPVVKPVTPPPAISMGAEQIRTIAREVRDEGIEKAAIKAMVDPASEYYRSELVDEEVWLDTIKNLPQDYDKSSVATIVKAVDGALLVRKFYAGESLEVKKKEVKKEAELASTAGGTTGEKQAGTKVPKKKILKTYKTIDKWFE